MPFQIDYGTKLPMGFFAESAPRGSEAVKVRLTGFVSSEDGDELIRYLEGVSEWVLTRLPDGKRPLESEVDHVLLLIPKDGKATAYVNELPMTGKIRLKRAVKAGEAVMKDHIADVHEVEFQGVDIPSDVGLVLVLSVGWRKAVFFDFTPIAPNDAHDRFGDPKVLLAEIYTYLSFQERFKISEAQWEELFRQRWFPFIGLNTDQLRSILTHAELGEPIDPLLEAFVEPVKALSERLRDLIQARDDLTAHAMTLTKALEHFQANDYLSCTTMLFTRIEGLIRDWKRAVAPGPVSQKTLAAAAVVEPKRSRHSLSLMLPQKFEQFLEEVYFANFDPENVQGVSRNTVSHGVAPEDQFNLKSALLGVLILDQLVGLMTPTDDQDEGGER